MSIGGREMAHLPIADFLQRLDVEQCEDLAVAFSGCG
jgi:hypothetical protein